jgi:hypothetical protein
MLHSLETDSVIIISIYIQRQKCYLTFHSRCPYCLFVWEVVILPALADGPAKTEGSFTGYSFYALLSATKCISVFGCLLYLRLGTASCIALNTVLNLKSVV